MFKFRGIDTITDAEDLAGPKCGIPRERAAAARSEGEFYQSDLIGCEVVDRATGVASV